jgi:hypothetical protein
MLITLADFTPYVDITSNIDVVRNLEPYILQAQICDLKPLLGEIFYQDLVTNFASANYQDLLNGKTYIIPNSGNYPIKFEGIKPILCYFAYARYIKRAGFKHTMTGLVAKNTPYSDPIEQNTLLRIANESMSIAGAYQKGLETFLYYNRSAYPVIDSIFNLPVSECEGTIWSIFQRKTTIKTGIRVSSTR